MNAQASMKLLNAGYGVFPLVAGADKFTNLLCCWDEYMSPLAKRFVPVRSGTFMRAVGVVEMAVGAAMFVPRLRRFAAFAASGWLCGIALNLIANRDYDIAARDVWLAVGAAALALNLPADKSLRPSIVSGAPAPSHALDAAAMADAELSQPEIERYELHPPY